MKGLQTFSFYFFHVFYVFIGFKNQFLTERLLHLFLQSVYLNGQRSVVMELDSHCNEKTPLLAASLSGLVFTKLGNNYCCTPITKY